MAKEKAPANDEAIAAAKKVLAERDTELSLLRPFKDKWQADEGQIEALKKDVGDASITIEDLRASRDKWRALADQRFTGLDLTGRRVVFLVDMSGSMEYIDDNTPAPQKWLEVRNTVAKLMHNLPDLEKFQVIVFSEKTKFLLGNDDKWLDFDAKTSPDKVTAALAAVKPDGGTNMYAGLDAAFRFRPQGLDAVYLLSDGLPNLGEGLKPEENAKLTELERAALLGTYIRKKLKTDWNTRKDGKAPVRLNSLGFFYESPDVGAFLWALSRENEGGFVGMSKP
jgi:hypothetical protein